MWSDIKLWLRRWWARHFGKPAPGYSGGMFRTRKHSHDTAERRSHEIGNVLWHNGKRRGKPTPTW